MYCQKHDVTLAGVFIAANVGELGSLFRGPIRKGCFSGQNTLVQGSLLWFKKLENWSPSDTSLANWGLKWLLAPTDGTGLHSLMWQVWLWVLVSSPAKWVHCPESGLKSLSARPCSGLRKAEGSRSICCSPYLLDWLLIPRCVSVIGILIDSGALIETSIKELAKNIQIVYLPWIYWYFLNE